MLKKEQFDKAMMQAVRQISQDVSKLRLVGTGRLRGPIDSRLKTRFPTRDEWRRAHADSTTPPLVYTGPNGKQITR